MNLIVARVALASAACAALPLYAAPKSTVQWTVKSSPKSISAGKSFQVGLHGGIEPGWHVYALQEPEGGPIATEIALAEGDAADLLRVDQSKPRTLNDPAFNMPTFFFADTVDFTLRLQAPHSASSGPHPLHILIRYQSCNDRMCLPPHTDQVDVSSITVR